MYSLELKTTELINIAWVALIWHHNGVYIKTLKKNLNKLALRKILARVEYYVMILGHP